MKIKQITDINTDKKKREELQATLDKIAPVRRRHIILTSSDGLCLYCDKLATKQIVYDISDSEQKASVVERYCNKHFTGLEKK